MRRPWKNSMIFMMAVFASTNGSKSLQDMLPLAAAFTPSHRTMFPRICGQSSNLQVSRHSSELSDMPPSSASTQLSLKLFFSTLVSAVQLATVSLLTAVTIIAWEDISSSHPMRSYAQAGAMASQQQGTERLKPFHLASTVRGMAFGQAERQRFLDTSSLGAVEPASTLTNIPSYNEVMLNHRVRVRKWDQEITQLDVEDSVRHLQLALMHILKCEHLAADYSWDELAKALRDPVVSTQLDDACDVLNRASDYLSLEARSEVGFDFGSCAWRHCGAFADVREAIDELDHLIGILEPFEAKFVLDVAERSIRDMLAVTAKFQDRNIHIPDYEVLQRKSDVDEDIESLDVDYLEALDFLKQLENKEAQTQMAP